MLIPVLVIQGCLASLLFDLMLEQKSKKNFQSPYCVKKQQHMINSQPLKPQSLLQYILCLFKYNQMK